ncbi:MAG: hypothetical protein MJ096_00980, partial [Clostridia bacterium]|nr:hypothetical protein [Clostridia bacterium]
EYEFMIVKNLSGEVGPYVPGPAADEYLDDVAENFTDYVVVLEDGNRPFIQFPGGAAYTVENFKKAILMQLNDGPYDVNFDEEFFMACKTTHDFGGQGDGDSIMDNFEISFVNTDTGYETESYTYEFCILKNLSGDVGPANWIDLSEDYSDVEGQVKLNLKKATKDVVIDGVINGGEYFRLDDENRTKVVKPQSGDYETSVTFYGSHSGDRVNLAAVVKADNFAQHVTYEDGRCVGDDSIIAGTSFVLNTMKADASTLLYYVVSKSTDDGSYNEGTYGGQVGELCGVEYNPVEGVDYVITYADGKATIEWSIPMALFTAAGETLDDGSELYLTFAAMNGEGNSWDSANTVYARGLGQMVPFANGADQVYPAIFVLEDYEAPAPAVDLDYMIENLTDYVVVDDANRISIQINGGSYFNSENINKAIFMQLGLDADKYALIIDDSNLIAKTNDFKGEGDGNGVMDYADLSLKDLTTDYETEAYTYEVKVVKNLNDDIGPLNWIDTVEDWSNVEGQVKVNLLPATAEVVLDGKVSSGEYFRLDDENRTKVVKPQSGDYETSAAFYASYTGDYVNLAAVVKADNFAQHVTYEGGRCVGDDAIIAGTSFVLNTMKADKSTILYYVVSKSTDDGSYNEGTYGGQVGEPVFGEDYQYDPEAGVDYVIEYSDGKVVIEWKVPIGLFTDGTIDNDTEFYFTFAAMNGAGNGWDSANTVYARGLGQMVPFANGADQVYPGILVYKNDLSEG